MTTWTAGAMMLFETSTELRDGSVSLARIIVYQAIGMIFCLDRINFLPIGKPTSELIRRALASAYNLRLGILTMRLWLLPLQVVIQPQ